MNIRGLARALKEETAFLEFIDETGFFPFTTGQFNPTAGYGWGMATNSMIPRHAQLPSLWFAHLPKDKRGISASNSFSKSGTMLYKTKEEAMQALRTALYASGVLK